jgi:hypothetical protein
MCCIKEEIAWCCIAASDFRDMIKWDEGIIMDAHRLSTLDSALNMEYADEEAASILKELKLDEFTSVFKEQEIPDLETMIHLSKSDLEELGLNQKQQTSFLEYMEVIKAKMAL